MSEQQIEANRLLVNRFYHEFFNQQQFGIAEEIITKDITFHGALGQQTNGVGQMINYFKDIRDKFPDIQSSVEELVAEEQKVAACITFRGTQEGEIFGIEPEGLYVQYVGVCIFIIRGDLISHAWELGDRLTLLEQLTKPEFDDNILEMDAPPPNLNKMKVPEWDE